MRIWSDNLSYVMNWWLVLVNKISVTLVASPFFLSFLSFCSICTLERYPLHVSVWTCIQCWHLVPIGHENYMLKLILGCTLKVRNWLYPFVQLCILVGSDSMERSLCRHQRIEVSLEVELSYRDGHYCGKMWKCSTSANSRVASEE